MSVIVKDIIKKSPAYKAGVRQNDTLVALNGNEIIDVLDYRFYQNDKKVEITFINAKGKLKKKTVKKEENTELGMEFETYLMDKQRSCRNKCIFCFVDQLPRGMRESLYFKDDDSRLSFLFGNYITLTNLTEHEINRIIKMHITPVNISVHTTNPELRVRMMKNKNAGEVLSIIDRFNAAGIKMNCQLVVCPGFNDGEELRRSLTDLTEKENIVSIAAVPVGISGHRENLPELTPFSRENAAETIDLINSFGEKCLAKYNERRAFAADEFYIIAEREMPNVDFYEDFPQLENGVGMWALTKENAREEVENQKKGLSLFRREVSVVTGQAAYPLIKDIVDRVHAKWHNLTCRVYPVKNEFFGGEITVTGLVTGNDIIKQLKGKNLGKELIVPATMLRHERDMFLDDITVQELSEKLGVKVRVIETDGTGLVKAILNRK